MKRASRRASPRLVWSIVLLLLPNTAIFAENIDPNNDGSKYAWSENLGWLNARPGGPSGQGVQVGDSSLTGWIWSENAGWISLSCANTSACGTSSYGVVNDACGGLSGRAWSENAGWIDFAPTTCGSDPSCGVKIGPTTGIFSGHAWSENAGWITFSATSPVAYQVMTSWRSTAPPPAGSPSVTAGKTGGSLILSWTQLAGATRYDVVQGTLSTLRSSHGSFQSATQACAANDTPTTSVTIVGTPSAGDGFWLLIRGGNCGGAGTYDSTAASQAGPRDAGIAASGHGCP
jgi:hypothetical protein